MNAFPRDKKLPTSYSAFESTRKTHSLLQFFFLSSSATSFLLTSGTG
jgi:hypothetical protein